MIEFLLFILTALLCGIGLILSSLAFSGTWLVLFAALITNLSIGFPTPGTLIVFALLCIATEALEAMRAMEGATPFFE